jgi:hypothetical protein
MSKESEEVRSVERGGQVSSPTSRSLRLQYLIGQAIDYSVIAASKLTPGKKIIPMR